MYRFFEIPYNFDYNLITALKAIDENFYSQQFLISSPDPVFKIYCFYVPIYQKDHMSVIRSGVLQDFLGAMSFETYASHLDNINKNYNGSIQLLINGIDNIVNEETILEYHNRFNINKFCVNNDEQAKIIRKCLPQADITASITMKLTKEEIEKLSEKLYNNVVLDFSFNKDFESIQNLPKKFKYIILANSICCYNCDGLHHWYKFDPKYKDYNNNIICPMTQDNELKKRITLRPMDLKYFDNYIYAYKLQDRGWSTVEIIKSLLMYVADSKYDFYYGISPFSEKYYSTQEEF